MLKRLKQLKQIIVSKEFLLPVIGLLLFQWTLYHAIVDQSENNLLPIRHEIKINGFEETENFCEQGWMQKVFGKNVGKNEKCIDYLDSETEKKLVLIANSVKTYQTESVEIVKGHFNLGDWNITMQLLLLSILVVVFFVVFRFMGIHPTPFLIPLFIILTVSIFYHNYLGHEIKDRLSVSIKSVVCTENCNNKNEDLVGTINCNVCNNEKEENKEECKYICKGIPDEYITPEKTVKIDKEKMRKKLSEAVASGIYPENQGELIKLNQENLDKKRNDINKYNRASATSREHFLFLIIGLFFFFISMITVKLVSKLENFNDSEFRFLISLSIVVGLGIVLVEEFIMHKSDGVTSLGEFLKISAIFLTVIGYEKINKNKHNLWLYILTLLLGIIALAPIPIIGRSDLGNMLILGVIVCFVFLITLSWTRKKLSVVIICLAGVVVLFYYGYTVYKPNSNLIWRVADMWGPDLNKLFDFPNPTLVETGALINPYYACKIKIEIKTNDEKKKEIHNFSFQRDRISEADAEDVCVTRAKDDKTKIVGFNKVKNCTDSDDKKICKLDDKKKNVEISCDKKDFGKRICEDQVNTDARLALFAVLKDGISLRPTGFQENTFLLNNSAMYTDFVFCGLIVFFGLPLAIGVFLCLIILIWNCNIKPRQCGNNYKHFLYSNIAVIILAVQAFIHIGGNLNVIPFTGVVLPFLSRAKLGTPVSFIALGLALGGLVSDDWINNFRENKFVKPIGDKIIVKFRNFVKKWWGKIENLIKSLSEWISKKIGKK